MKVSFQIESPSYSTNKNWRNTIFSHFREFLKNETQIFALFLMQNSFTYKMAPLEGFYDHF